MGLHNLLYIREALGKDGAPIKVYKIRTMSPDTGNSIDDTLLDGLDNLGKPRDHHRVTPLGRLLRKCFIDELPQIYNLLRGDLALVGLRPRSEKIWDKYDSTSIMNHALHYRPGLLGVIHSCREIKDLDHLKEVELEYLQNKDESPVLTDIRYFFRIVYNIIFRGVRSM